MSLHSHWSTATDKIFIKKIYDNIGSHINQGTILDLGVEDYNFNCNEFIGNNSIEYWQLEPNRVCENNDGFFNCTVQECLEMYPGNENKFDSILDFGVLGWNGIRFSQKEQEKYVTTILKLLKPGGLYILHGDRVEEDMEYKINIDKFISPNFELVSVMGFKSHEIIECPRWGTVWDIRFLKKK
tara:strand:+ start:8049 stop:8600 length:552 start_codon:yes stop_codon:yes gene_type:complete